jgi:hypothetical protein
VAGGFAVNARRYVLVGFGTQRLEGVLLQPDRLEKAAQGRESCQQPEVYHVPRGFTLQEEIGCAFRMAKAQWKAYRATRERTELAAAGSAHAFVEEVLRDALGYTGAGATAPPIVGERRFPLTLHAAANFPVAPATLDRDDPDPAFAPQGGDARKKSAFQLLQEYLNAAPDARWGLASKGRKLRVARDAATLPRPSFIEFDLETMRGRVQYPDFAARWRLLHASRATGAPEAVWELRCADGQREGLRSGGEAALRTLGEGLLKHPADDSPAARRSDDQGYSIRRRRELLPDPERRAQLRAERDADYARRYGLTREDHCSILDPASVMGADYPSETFRVLADKEFREFGEYRTQRLVLEAWGRLYAAEINPSRPGAMA